MLLLKPLANHLVKQSLYELAVVSQSRLQHALGLCRFSLRHIIERRLHTPTHAKNTAVELRHFLGIALAIGRDLVQRHHRLGHQRAFVCVILIVPSSSASKMICSAGPALPGGFSSL